MADFNKILDAGGYADGTVNVVVEIPEGSHYKVEWDRKVGYFKLDRVENKIFAKPTNYGFIPQTLDEDGDELDVLLIADAPLPMGLVVEAKILGVMKFSDDGEVDDKIIAVPADDRNLGNIYNSLDDLPKKLIEQIEFHFNHYKDLKKPGSTKVASFEGALEAKQVIKDAIARWAEQAN